MVLFFIYCGFALDKLMFNPVLVNNSYNIFFSSFLNTDTYNISTTYSTLAVRITGSETPGEHLQVVFSSYSNSCEPEYIDAVDCRSFFATEIAASNSGFFRSVFPKEPEPEQWMCPDTT